jgi:hypothetical protein
MTPFELIILIIGVALAVANFSFIWFGASIPFDICESIIIGSAITMNIFAVWGTLQSSLFAKLTDIGNLWLLIPLVIGALAFTRLTRFRWLARYPISIMSGVGVGVMTGPLVRTQILDFTISNINAVVKQSPDIFSALILFVGGVFCTTYYLYSVKYSTIFHKGRLSWTSKIGRWILFAGFGELYAMIFINEGIDALTTMLITIVYRTINALTTGIYA